MEAYQQFLSIVGDTDGALLRGVNLGDQIDAVLPQEETPDEHRTGPVAFYSFSPLLSKDFRYALTYYYDADQRVKIISLTLGYNTEQVTDYTLEEFTAVTDEFDLFLREKYGEPVKAETVRHKNDREQYLTWIDRTRPDFPVQVTQVYYAYAKRGLLKAMKLEFQKHYDD